MTSQSGTMYKVIVTSLLLGVIQFIHVAQCVAGPTAPTSVQNTAVMYGFPPSATSHVIFSSPPRNLDVAESGHFFSDGAIASYPLHGLGFSGPGLTGFMNIRGHNPFIRAALPPSGSDILQTAAQTYFIEPVQPTTTTQRPTFTKRKTRRPITVLAEQSKRNKAAAAALQNDNSANEIHQGNPVPFNPFRQIVNTSFGRSRPSESKLGRSRSRQGAGGKQEKQETGSNADKSQETLNEIPPAEGEPRALGQRRKPQDIRPIRPTSSFSPLSSTQNNDNDSSGLRELPKPRRFPPRPRLSRPDQGNSDADSNPSGGGDVTNPPLPPRPRNLSRRPRPTTTLSSNDDETEITPGVTTGQTQAHTQTTQAQSTFHHTQPHSTSPQTQPPQPPSQEPRRARPGRPLGGAVRFGGNRLSLTTTPLPEPDLNLDQPLPTRARRLRPSTSTTAQQGSNPSTASPDFSRLPQSPDVPRTEGRPFRGDKQGFILRPRPTPSPSSADQQSDNEVGVTTRPRANRRRKRPTTTVETPVRPSIGSNARSRPAVNYNQQFTGGIVQQNAVAQPVSQNENEGPAPPVRRVPQVVRNRPSPFSNPELPPPSYQIRDEQPALQPVRGQIDTFRNPIPAEQPVPGATPIPLTSPVINSASLFRRPTGPSAPPAIQPQPIPQLQQNFIPSPNANQALTGPTNFVNSGLYNFPSQENLGFYNPGFDNVLGVSSNRKTVKESPNVNLLRNNQFSARTTVAADEPEISHSDFSPASSSEKKSDGKAGSSGNSASGESTSQETKVESPTSPPKKLSPLERLQQNRQAAARRLLTPRKPAEQTTPAPPSQSQAQKTGKALRKSVIPPRMLRPRGKLLKKEDEKVEEPPSAPQQSNEVREAKSIENNNGEINNESTSSAEPDTESNVVPISPNPKTEEIPTSSRKPTILENAMRRRIPLPGRNSPLNKQQSQENMKLTPPTPANQDPDAPPPTCEAGQRYSKFLKRCVTMYKPKASG